MVTAARLRVRAGWKQTAGNNTKKSSVVLTEAMCTQKSSVVVSEAGVSWRLASVFVRVAISCLEKFKSSQVKLVGKSACLDVLVGSR